MPGPLVQLSWPVHGAPDIQHGTNVRNEAKTTPVHCLEVPLGIYHNSNRPLVDEMSGAQY
eukprot:11961886-Karenia_brevis.AAC.1